MHLAPRTIKIGRSFPKSIRPTYGVVAGDNHANDFAKVVIYYSMEALARKHEGVVLRTYVDNLRQSTRGAKDQAIRQAVATTA